MGRLSGLNKLGSGQAEIRTPSIIGPERAPAEVHLHPRRFHMATQRGRAYELLWRDVLVSACPLPSLFNLLRRPI
jgi:hypothetical protein